MNITEAKYILYSKLKSQEYEQTAGIETDFQILPFMKFFP